MTIYKYEQNNSGGAYIYDDQRGISQIVLIYAENASEADFRAGDIGIYFDGVFKGRDCECCGDRWYEASEHDTWDGVEPLETWRKRHDGPSAYFHGESRFRPVYTTTG